LKNDVSSISKRFSIGSEKLEKILSAQRFYFNKSGLEMTSETIPLIDFPKVNERIKQRPTKAFYRNHFQKVFVKLVGRSALKCSKLLHFEHLRALRSIDFIKTF